MAGPVADAERVTVRRGLRGAHDADAGAGAGDVLDDDGLAERYPHALAQNAGERIRRTARRKRHDDGDGMRWIGLRMRLGNAARRNGERRENGCQFHGCPRVSRPRFFRNDGTRHVGAKVSIAVTTM